jgi:hypothetical protein
MSQKRGQPNFQSENVKEERLGDLRTDVNKVFKWVLDKYDGVIRIFH